MRYIFIFFIRIYQATISPDHGILKKLGIIRHPVCVFTPTCSEYTAQALMKYGSIKGIALGLRRVARCHPWQK